MIEGAVDDDRHPGETGDPTVLAAVDQVEAELAELTGIVNAANARITELVAQLLTNGGWSQGGIHSPQHYLGWKMGLSPAKAHQYVAVAARIGELPACAAAFEAGELSMDQAATVVAHAPAWTDTQVCRFAKLMTLRQLRHLLSRYAFDPTPTGPPTGEPPAPEREKREVRFGTSGGRWRLHADLPADEGAFIEQALVACRDDLFHQHHNHDGTGGEGDDGNTDTTDDAGDDDDNRKTSCRENGCEHAGAASEVTWADTLSELAERALAAGAAARPHADRYRVLFHHHIDPASQPVMAAHGTGEALPEVLRRYWTCDATAIPVNELNGTPVSVGRSQRIVPDRTRRLIEHRDGGCVIPGCSRRHYLVIHHVVHWSDGGTTDTWNLVAICPIHHRAVHLGHLHLTGDADKPGGLTMTNARGRPLTGAAHTTPPSRPPREAAHTAGLHPRTWRHPLGEKLRYDDVHFNVPASGIP